MKTIKWIAFGIIVALTIMYVAKGIWTTEASATETHWVVVETATVSMIESLKPELDPSIRSQIANTVDVVCTEQNLPVELVLAIMCRESSFRTMAVSSMQCVGLMQINPKAHPALCEPYTWAELYHIQPNIEIGCRILKEYLKSSDSIQKALSRYVGGNHNGYVTDVLAIYAELKLTQGVKS